MMRRFALAAGGGGLAYHLLGGSQGAPADAPWLTERRPPPSRSVQLDAVRKSGFDILVVGGGATGAGVALDAATRGLRVALVEAEDFSTGTSSRSTKLLHGGVRYLEKAVWQLDYGQLKLVFEALRERTSVLKNAPHLSNSLPTLMPCYELWEVPYFWAGMKAYDFLAGSSSLTWSRFVSMTETLRLFPQLAPRSEGGSQLKGAIVYYDGQFNDSRLNVALATTAAAAGAVMLNYVRVVSLIKDGEGTVIGARCRDMETGQEFDVQAKCVVNAGGPLSDGLRKLADQTAQPMITPSSGVHITLPSFYSPEGLGLIVPKTKDGRVVFLLPWMGATIAGTTDNPVEVTAHPRPTTAEVDYILKTLSGFLSIQVDKRDVLSSWSGIRPLASDPTRTSTENIVRDHVVALEGGLITITGGKWTTYRKMAEDAVNAAIAAAGLAPAKNCHTDNLRLVGAGSYTPSSFVELLQARSGGVELDEQVAKHLSTAYGDLASDVVALSVGERLCVRLDKRHPVLEGEVVWAVRYEMCRTAADFLARRCRLAFLDVQAAQRAAPRVVDLLARELGWNRARRRRELKEISAFLNTFATTV